MTALHPATLAQNRAANPVSSTWLSANAGSGKTRVLTDRVARLLLAGVDPQNILCLTYTKAAASEMQNRLFQRLGAWSMLADDLLRNELRGLGVEDLSDLSDARTLFARAIETPGGLKIQTIHSFCAALLRRFPLEAGVSLGFTEMDGAAQAHLIADILDQLAEQDAGGCVSGVARYQAGDDLGALAMEVVKHRLAFKSAPSRDEILGRYGLSPGYSAASLDKELQGAGAILRAAAPILAAGSASEQKVAATLRTIDLDGTASTVLPVLEGPFLFGKTAATPFGSKAGKFPTKATRAAHPGLADDLDRLMDTVERLRGSRLALEAAEKSHALHDFATAFLPAYEAAKQARGWLDFDDLILRTTALLSDPSVAAWVLYRLDGGIDHVLVDESQDTSPAQWRIVELLTQELGSGDGARADVPRTLFVVGDKKQSIYSFQGADADAFERMQAAFTERLRAQGGLQGLSLAHSFRSSPAILAAVDATFEAEAGADLGTDMRHISFHDAMPGRVDLWPVLPKADAPEDGDWTDPVDMPAPSAASNVLADKIAREIRRMIDAGTVIAHPKDGARPVGEGDFLILVQGRSGGGDLFHKIIRACKVAGLAVAGADRLKIGGELAVRDLRALLSVLALPEDSLSLAASLRSPLFGWSERELYGVAAGREERHLWPALRNQQDAHPETWAMISDLRDAADFLRPYDLIERILIRHRGRERLIARLGPEAEDGVDELLNQALLYEAQETPSLTGFLAWLDGEDVEVKRQLDQGGGRIRVMTVHGAKGLEAPVVVLPDTLRARAGGRDAVVVDGDGAAHWKPSADATPAALAPTLAQAAEAETRERQRLLYVAMTRAESWLIVCGAGDEEKTDGTWYGTVEAGLSRLDAGALETPTGTGRRFARGDWPADQGRGGVQDTGQHSDLPRSATRPADPPDPTPRTVSPSALGGAKALPGDAGADEETALRRGRQMHLLLEHLPLIPADARAEFAEELLAFGEDAAPREAARAMAAEVSALLDAPALSHLFEPEALAEVHITATLPELQGRRVHGAIDRLLIGDTRILAVDFKTNAVVPDTPATVPDGLLRQMGAYRAALMQIYPGRDVNTAILWTRAAALMPLPNDIVMKALQQTTIS
ncbi:MAG: double-strand break repair helicase AddA [Pseudomonadota bacterium]